MAKKRSAMSLPAAQRRNFRALARHNKEINVINKKLDVARQRRHAAVLRIFDEIEKHPEGYTHVIQRGKRKDERALTPVAVRKLRRKYESQMLKQKNMPNPRGGPGCSECDDIFECWCAFGAGPLCCYLCFSWKVIRCYF